jgi:hypothetical protein
MCLGNAFCYRRLAAMRLRRVLHVLFGIGAEHLIGHALLRIGHRVVQLLERGNQLLHPLSVVLGELLIGLHILHGVHRRELLSALHEGLIHIARVFAHDLGEFIPLRFLGRSNLQLTVQFLDPALDALFPGTGCPTSGEAAAAGGGEAAPCTAAVCRDCAMAAGSHRSAAMATTATPVAGVNFIWSLH